MLREQLGLAFCDLGGMGFERFGDLRVQLLPRSAQKGTVRRVPYRRMLEYIDGVGQGPLCDTSSDATRRASDFCSLSSGSRQTARSSA